MSGCVELVDKLSKAVVQTERLYALYTGSTYVGWFFVRRPSTTTPALRTVFAHRFWQNQSVKFSYAHFAQGLLIQINKEGH